MLLCYKVWIVGLLIIPVGSAGKDMVQSTEFV